MAQPALPFDAYEEERRVRQLHISTLLDSGQGSDITLKCNGHEWKVHSYILRARSSYLNRKLGPPLNLKPGQFRVIELNDEDPCVVQLLLNYMYRAEYAYGLGVVPYFEYTTGEKVELLEDHIEVYKAAIKFGVEGLDKLAKRYMAEVVEYL